MGTRAVINFQGDYNCVMLYRHWDGSPETIMPELQNFRKSALENDFWGYAKNNPSRLALQFMQMYPQSNYQPESKIDNWVEYIYWVFSTMDQKGDIFIDCKELKSINIQKED